MVSDRQGTSKASEPKRAEFVWPGKYEDGRLREVPRRQLSLRVAERVDGAGFRRTRDWTNRLVWGDNLAAMASLAGELSGQVDLIYLDPPFASGSDYRYRARVGGGGFPDALEGLAYEDRWGEGGAAFFTMLYDRLRVAHELLSERGTLYLHLDWSAAHQARLLLDEVFGADNSLGEIVWAYGSPSGGRSGGRKLVKGHDLILVSAKHYGRHRFRRVFLPYSERYLRDWFRFEDDKGRRYRKRWRRGADGGTRVERQYLDESKGLPASTVWSDIQQLYADPRAYRRGACSEISGYPTQKPLELLQRIIEISSEPGDLVADFFCGSGTALVAAEAAGRRWIGCDRSRFAIHTTRKRLQELNEHHAFDLLDFGSAEREMQAEATAATILTAAEPTAAGARRPRSRGKVPHAAALACLSHVPEIAGATGKARALALAAYGARPIEDADPPRGWIGRKLVAVGPLDTPISSACFGRALQDVKHRKAAALDVLGWSWCVGTESFDLLPEHLKVRFRQIPCEALEVPTADLQPEFRPPPFVRLRVGGNGGRRHIELLELREPLPGLSGMDGIDYWAVDWNWDGGPFEAGWAAWRRPGQSKLALTSDAFPVTEDTQVAVQIVDVWGVQVIQLVKP